MLIVFFIPADTYAVLSPEDSEYATTIALLEAALDDMRDTLNDLQKQSLQKERVISYQDKEDIKIQNFIMQCESGGNPKSYGAQDIKITGYPSRGLFQFQPYTFLRAGIQYGVFPENITLKQAMKYIYNPAYNAAVAHGLIKDGKYQHWQTCYSKYKRAEKNMNLLARRWSEIIASSGKPSYQGIFL